VILVDTNVISESARRNPDRGVLSFLLQHPVVGLSAVSVLELEAGVRAAPVAKRGKLGVWLDSLLESGAVEVIPVDTAIARMAGKLRADARRRPVALEDVLIGATALTRGMTLATRNTRHFERLGVSLVNPFA
jgi:predicted nucleic acid-binding protein